MRTLIIIVFCIMLIACQKQSKEELLNQGLNEIHSGNSKGAVIYLLNALEIDPGFTEARKNLAACYLEIGKFQKAEDELQTILEQSANDMTAALTLAQIYNKTQRPGKALALAEPFLKSDEADQRVYEVLADSYHFLENDQKAYDFYLLALENDPANLTSRYGLARTLRRLGDLDAARKQLHEIIAVAPKSRNAYFELVNIESSQGKGDESLEILNSYIELVPEDTQALYMAAMLFINNNSIDEAEAIADRMLAAENPHPAARQIKGLVYFSRNNYAEAIVELKQQLKMMDEVVGNFYIGQAYYHTNQLELALNHFHRALDLDPDHIKSRLLIAYTLLTQKRFDECINEIVKLRKIDENNANAFYLLGHAYMGKGNYDRAIEALDQALKINPELVQAQVKKGLFTVATGNYENAEAELTKAISVAPEVTDNRLLLAKLQLNQKKFSEVLETLEKGLSQKAEDALLYNFMAAAYFGLGQEEQAIKAFDQSKQLKPEFLTPYFNLARYFVFKNNFARAYNEYQSILSVDANNVKALLELGALSQIDGKQGSAEEYYQKASLTGDLQALLTFAHFNQQNGHLTTAMASVDQAYNKAPKDPRVLSLRGRLAMALKQFDKMEESFMALEEVSRGSGLTQLIGFYLNSDQVDKALGLAEKQIAEQPDSSHGYNLTASVLTQSGQSKRAEEILQQGIQAAPQEQLSLQINLINLYITTGQLDEVKELLETLNPKAAKTPAVLSTWGNYYNLKGDTAQARRYFEATLEAQENHTFAQNNLAYLYANDPEKLEEALGLAMQAYRANPGNPSIMDTLGYVLLKNSYGDKAVTLLERAVVLLPQNNEVKLHLAQAYLSQKEQDKARELLRGIMATATPLLAEEAKVLLETSPDPQD